MRTLLVGLVLNAAFAIPTALAQTMDRDRRAIETAFDEVIAAAKRGDATAYLTYFAKDAVLAEMTPGQQPVVGANALRPWITDFLAKYTFDWSDYKSEEILIAGDLAFHRYTGVASFAPKSGGDTMRLHRRYIDMLRRDSRGGWKIWHHVWTATCEQK